MPMTPTDDDRKAAARCVAILTSREQAYLAGILHERERAARVAEDDRASKALPPYDGIRPNQEYGEFWPHVGYRIAAAFRSGCTPGCTEAAYKPEQTGTNRDGLPESAPRPEPRENPGESAI